MLQLRTTRRACSRLLLITATLAAPSLAIAQTASASEAEAHEQYRRAIEAFNQKNWSEAQRLLLELWNQSQTYDVALTLGQVEYQLKNYAVAVRYLSYAVTNVPPFEKPETVRHYRALLDEAKAVVGTAKVSVNEPQADILIDGEVVGKSPLAEPLYLDIGPRRIQARLGQRQSEQQTIDVLAGGQYSIDLQLPPAAAEQPVATGQQDPPDLGSDSEKRKSKVPAIVSWSVGGAALLGGVVMFVVAKSKDSEREDLLDDLTGTNPCGTRSDTPSDCARIDDLAESSATFQTLSLVSLGVAVAGGITGFLLWPTSNESPPTARGFAPEFTVRPGGWQLGASGRF